MFEIYFDHAATGFPKSRSVLKAVQKAGRSCANAGRGGHRLAEAADEALFDCRKELAALFTVSPEQVILTKNATEALNLAIGGLPSGGTVVCSDLEHNAVRRPLCLAEQTGKYRIRRFHASEDWRETLENFCAALTEDVHAAVFCHASNVCGLCLPVDALCKEAHTRGITTVIDGAQTAGHRNVNCSELGCDAYCLPGHKGLYGPLGTGALILKHGVLPPPLLAGGTGGASIPFTMPDEIPERYEAGTMNAPAFAGLAQAVREVKAKSEKEKTVLQQLFLLLLDGLEKIPDITVFGAPSGSRKAGNYVPVVSFCLRGQEPYETAAYLAEKGIFVRAGMHCAPWAHQTLGSPEGSVRVSIGRRNTVGQVEKLLSVLRKLTAR